MLKQLLPLLKKGDTLGLSIGMEGENKYRINVTPRLFTLDGENGPDRKALNRPLTVAGTAEELDAGLIEALTRFAASNTELRNTIDNVEAEHKAAAEAKKKNPAKTSKPEPAKSTAGKSSWKDRVKPKAGATEPAAAEPEKVEPPASAEEATEAFI